MWQSKLECYSTEKLRVGKWIFIIISPGRELYVKKSKRKVQGVSQSQSAALHRHQEEEEADKTKQAQIVHTYKKH